MELGKIEMPIPIRGTIEHALMIVKRLRESNIRRPPKILPNLCDGGCVDGWGLVEKGGETWAEPCSICKPNWTHPSDRVRSKTDEQIKEELRARKKDELDQWWDK